MEVRFLSTRHGVNRERLATFGWLFLLFKYDILITRGGRVKYLGHIQCPTDGYSYITDAKQVVIYFSPDSVSYYTEVICNECGYVVEGNIDKEFLLIFMGHGCKVLPYGNKFSQLTEDMISEWDIDDELRLFDGAKQY